MDELQIEPSSAQADEGDQDDVDQGHDRGHPLGHARHGADAAEDDDGLNQQSAGEGFALSMKFRLWESAIPRAGGPGRHPPCAL